MTKLAILVFGLVVIAPYTLASDREILQSQWAEVTYNLTEDERLQGLEDLADLVRQLSEAHPNDAEILIWKGIIISSLAGEKGGFGALGLAREAKAALEAAVTIDDTTMAGSAYTTLGTLHHKVPGWPIGFGSDRKARKFLQRALAMNPDGIDPNYFMGEFLYDEGELAEARRYLVAALRAPGRSDQMLADSGRRQTINELLLKMKGSAR